MKRWLIATTAIAVAATRIWARSRTLWDWDETLFSLGVRSYDVTVHHPHPPGFPLYVAMAKALRPVVHSDFHALQAINLLAAVVLFPLLFWFALELRFPFRSAYLGSLLFMFFPNVWFFGGTAFSDIPGLALLIAACAMLMRGCSSRRAYFAGALLLGLAAAIRPQALLIGCPPALYASWCRKRTKDVAIAAAIGVAVIAIAYGGAALASESVRGYFQSARLLREYVRKVDSYLNPERVPVKLLLPRFFLHPTPGGVVAIVIAALAAISLISCVWRRHSCLRVWMLVLMFLPFNIIGLFMLDPNSISRYSIGYGFMYAMLAVDALAAFWPVQVLAVIAIMGRLIWWTLPALRDVRATVSPPVAAMEWIHSNVSRARPLYFGESMGPFIGYLLPEYNGIPADHATELPVDSFNAHDWLVIEGPTSVADGHNFDRQHGSLYDIARRRYFEVATLPLSDFGSFGSGWYPEEGEGAQRWRWMGHRSEMLLPPIAGKARLTLNFDLPTELAPRHPNVDVYVNGQLVDRIVCTTVSVTRTVVVPSRGDAWNQLVISMDKVLNPAKEGILPDDRDLGLELTSYGWQPTG